METKMRTRLFTLFLNLVMFVTFNLSTFPNGFADEPTTDDPVVTENVDTPGANCEDTDPSATGGAYIYKPGCKFQEDKVEVQTWTPETVNKIIMGLLAVVSIASAVFAPVEIGLIDCPGNFVATSGVTLRAIQAASIAYIAGEIQANIRYKSAAKKATDITFATQKTEDQAETNKQVEAFNNLIEIYEKQIGAAKTKKALTTIAEVAYAAAAGVEAANMVICKASCQATHKAALASLDTALGKYAAVCPAASAMIPTLKAEILSAIATDLADAANAVSTAAENASFFQKFVTNVPAADTLTSAANTAKDVILRTAMAGKNEQINTTALATITKMTAAAAAEAAKPPYTCAGATALEAIPETSLAFLAQKSVPCCGTDSLYPKTPSSLRPDQPSGSTIFMNPAGTSKFGAKKDIYFLNLLGESGNLIEGTIIKNDNKEKRKIDEMTTLVAYNAVYENASEEILNSNLSKEEKLRKISSLGERLDQAFEYLDKNMNGFALPYQEEAGNRLADALFGGDTNTFTKILNEVSNNIAISHAYAEGGWMKVLGWAGAILVLRMALKQIYTKFAGTSPTGRMVLFTVLSAVGGYVLAQDAKTLKTLKKRKKVLEEEKDKFIGANSETSVIGTDKNGPGLQLENTEYTPGERGLGNYPGCIAPTGKTYGPVKCPSIIKRDTIKIPALNDRTKKMLTNAHVGALGALSDVAYNAAKGSYLDNPNLLSGALADATKYSNAIRAHNKKLRAKLDEIQAKSPVIKDKKGKVVKPLSLNNFHDNMMKSFGGGLGGAFGGAELAKDSTEDDAKEESTDNKVAAVNIPNFQTGVPANTGFGLDLGLGGDDSSFMDESAAAGSEENKLEDYVLEQNDINKKAEVSIFKILSNRYLLSYPKVLEEKK